MKNGLFAVLDIGSQKITTMVASSVNSNEFAVKATGESQYSGYDESGFFEIDSLTEAIRSSISQVENKLQVRIKNITIGVPAMFCTLCSSEARLIFNEQKKVEEEDVAELFKRTNTFNNINGTLISKNPLCYYLDEAVLEFNPVGKTAERLTAVVSYTFLNNNAVAVLDKVCANLNLKAKYVNASEMQAKFINDMYSVGGYSLVVDIGHIASSFMVARGKGLAFSRAFSLGSGYFAADLSQIFGIRYDVACLLLNKINLRLDFANDQEYEVNGVRVNAVKANEVVKARIEQFAEYIVKCFGDYNLPIPDSTPIVLTGGGLTYIKGGADWLSNYLGKEVTVYDNYNPRLAKNEYTSIYGILQNQTTKTEEKSILAKIKSIFGGK